MSGVAGKSILSRLPSAVARGGRLQTRAAQKEEEAADASAVEGEEGDTNFVKAALAQVHDYILSGACFCCSLLIP